MSHLFIMPSFQSGRALRKGMFEAYADNENPDQKAFLHSQFITLAVRLVNHKYNVGCLDGPQRLDWTCRSELAYSVYMYVCAGREWFSSTPLIQSLTAYVKVIKINLLSHLFLPFRRMYFFLRLNEVFSSRKRSRPRSDLFVCVELLPPSHSGGGGGGGKGNLGVIMVRVFELVFRNLNPFIYLAFGKTDPFIY